MTVPAGVLPNTALGHQSQNHPSLAFLSEPLTDVFRRAPSALPLPSTNNPPPR